MSLSSEERIDNLIHESPPSASSHPYDTVLMELNSRAIRCAHLFCVDFWYQT